MAVEDRRQRPLDNFEQDEAHRGFGEALASMGKLSPRLDDSNPVVSEVVALTRIDPVKTTPQMLVCEGRVLVRMGSISLSYEVDAPEDINISGAGESDRVINAVSSLHRASVKSLNIDSSEIERRLAIFAKAEAAGILLACGRPDLIQANRALFDKGIPGVVMRTP